MGPIATEVVEGLSKSSDPVPVRLVEPAAVRPTQPINIQQESGSEPIRTTDKNQPKTYSPAWWMQNYGPTGVVCFLLIGAMYWMSDSQSKSQEALVKTLQEANKSALEERRQITTVLLNTQAEISMNMARMARSVERLEAKVEIKKE